MKQTIDMMKIVLILLCSIPLAKFEDVVESSGDSEAVILDSSEVPSSGEGAEGTQMPAETIDHVSDPDSDILSNVTTHPFVINNGELETTSDSAEMDVTSTTTESLDQTTTEEIATTTTTTTHPPTTTTTTEAATEPMTTTTTRPTTKETTTMKTTTSTMNATTRRPEKLTSKQPTFSTTTTTEFPLDETNVCGFLELDFTCDEVIKCFGEGLVDCNDLVEDEEPISSGSVVAATTTEDSEYDEDYIDARDGSSHLGRKTPPTTKDPSSSWRTRTAITTTSTSTSTEESTTPLPTTSTTSSTTSTTTEATTTTTETTTPEITTTESTTTSTESSGVSTTSESNSTAGDSSSGSTETTNVVSEDATEKMEEAEDGDSEERKRRRKRQSKSFFSEAMASGSLSLTESNGEKETIVDRKKRCKVTGNLRCFPPPTIGICRGKGTCQAPMEKAEKSSEKGVETWAIAVIAICAAAAVLTVALLIYLVITSWKKLKVQPQNGVTTLTYVNNSTPP